MHNCCKTEAQLTDLLFSENEAEKQRLMQEITACAICASQYHSMIAALRTYDHAAEMALPDESYWPDYQARLRARLQSATTPNAWERLTEIFSAWWAGPLVPLTVAGLLLIIAASMIFFARSQDSQNKDVVAKETPTPQPAPTVPMPEQVLVKQTPAPPQPRRMIAAPRKRAPVRRSEERAPDNLIVADFAPRDIPTLAPERHFEKAQLLLRSFRNARLEAPDATFDLVYEKRKSKELVYDNILLRREAAARGNLPVEEVLSSLEPLLLDIANLPDKPAPDDVQAIRARVRKTEIVATLQLHSTRPVELNQ
jgi:phosphate/sulfate permease